MGIQGFHKWIESIIKLKKANKHKFNNIYIDMNFMLHMACYNSYNQNSLIKKVQSFILELLENIIPINKIIFASDGRAPLAKLLLQRERRLAMIRKQDKITEKTVTPLMLTPGTIFMKHLDEKMKDFYEELENMYNIKTERYFDSDNEAEIKILKHINENSKLDNTHTHLLFSNDADVIIMCASNMNYKNINIGLRKNKDNHIINIGELVQTIFEKDTENINLDFTFISLLLGNDYIPKLSFITIEKIIDCYKKVVKNKTLINSDCTINLDLLQDFVFVLNKNLSKNFRNKFNMKDYDDELYKNYYTGLLWSLKLYRNTEISDYFYHYDQSPHPAGLFLFLIKNRRELNNIMINCEYYNITNDMYAILALPKKAIVLIDQKYHECINNKLEFLYDEEMCETCIRMTEKLNKDFIKLKALEDFGEEEQFNKFKLNYSKELKEFSNHKKIHKSITIEDIKNAINILADI
jgi:5'-3' exonuclease